MRSTRATAAVARLSRRCPDRQFRLVITGDGLFALRVRENDAERALGTPLPLDDFVRFVDTQGPQVTPRVSKSDAAFARQLQRKGD